MSTALTHSTKNHPANDVHWGGVVVAGLIASVLMGMMSMMSGAARSGISRAATSTE